MRIIRNLLKPLSFLPAIFIMYLIIGFSSQDGVTSSELSYKVSYKIVEIGGEILDADLQPWEIESYANRFHGPIRKIAHMTEYFALAVSMSFPLYVYGLRGIWLMLVAGILCVGFACCDEYYQSKIAGRMPSKKDVAIDSFGIFWGIVLVRIVGWTGRKTIFRPFCKKKKAKRTEDYAPDMIQVPYSQTQYPPQPGYAPNHAQPVSAYPPNHLVYTTSEKRGRKKRKKNSSAEQPYMNSPYSNMPYSNMPYSNVPPQNRPYNGTPYPNRQNIHPNHAYANRPYNGTPGPYAPYQQYQQQRAFTPAPAPVKPEPEEVSYSDSLSEDMSLKKLMHDIKDQKKAAYSEIKHAWKPSVDGTNIPDNEDL